MSSLSSELIMLDLFPSLMVKQQDENALSVLWIFKIKQDATCNPSKLTKLCVLLYGAVSWLFRRFLESGATITHRMFIRGGLLIQTLPLKGGRAFIRYEAFIWGRVY